MRADIDKDIAEGMAAQGNEKLQGHSTCKTPPIDCLFVAKPMTVLN